MDHQVMLSLNSYKDTQEQGSTGLAISELKTGGNPLWQYRLWSFQGRDIKLEGFLAKNLHVRKSLNFENWSSGELSKISHHFIE